jgi:site-specific DNA-adenine methylase
VATLDHSASGTKSITVLTNPTFVAQDCQTSQGNADAVVVIYIDPPFNPKNAFYVVLN